jgi:U3 small nucleolar RNA-associated protein 16
MFAQIFNTARRVLSRSPSVQEAPIESINTPQTSTDSAHSLEVTMVTTRRGTETPGQEPTSTPRSGSAKRKVGKRELEALETPTAAKRQKKTTPNKTTPSKTTPKTKAVVEEEPALDSAEDTSDTITVTLPDGSASSAEGKLPIRRRSSPKVVVGKLSPIAFTETEGGEEAQEVDVLVSTQESVLRTPEQRSEITYATPTTSKKPDGSPTPRARRANERTSAKKPSARKNKKHVEVEEGLVDVAPSQSSFRDEIPSSTYNSEQALVSSQGAPATPAQSKKAHLRFGSEELEDEAPATTQAAAPDATPQDDDDSASDSDEAPEVVTTTAAASKAKASQQDTARALLAQQEKERAKREAREQRIADEQAEKRKREEKKAKKLAKQAAKQQENAAESDIEPTAAPSIDLAGLLPTSLLSNISDQRAPTPPFERLGKTEEQLRKEKLSHHIKFLERADKGIKDLKKGRLNVAVLAQQNRVLPPKANRDTRNVREKWMKGRQVKGKKVKGDKGIGGKVERKGFGKGGFLRGED